MKRLLLLVALLGLCACAEPPVPSAPQAQAPQRLERVQLAGNGGVYRVMVGIDKTCCFSFVLDTGASDVSVSPQIFRAMVHDGLITQDDMIDVQKYRTAGGTIVEGIRFRIPVMTIGGLRVRNVLGSVSAETQTSMMLLGQSFLGKFRFWAIDNGTRQLVLGY